MRKEELLHITTETNSDEVPEFDILGECEIDLSEEIPEPEPLLQIGDITLFSKGNISTIGGAAKSRKTFLIVFLTAKFLEENPDQSAMIYDTEMAKFHTIRTARRVHRLIGWEPKKNNKRLKVFSVREYNSDERIKALQQAIERYKPALVFVDGVRDLVKDFNSPDESSNIVNLLMKWSSLYECHICSVLHENKIGGQLRGHLGTEIVNKSETVIGVSSSGNVSTVKPLFTRNMPFEEFYFTINMEGLPELCKPEQVPTNTDKLKQLFESVLGGKESVSYTELRNALINKLKVAERTAERKINDGVKLNVICKNEVNYYHLPKIELIDESLPF